MCKARKVRKLNLLNFEISFNLVITLLLEGVCLIDFEINLAMKIKINN